MDLHGKHTSSDDNIVLRIKWTFQRTHKSLYLLISAVRNMNPLHKQNSHMTINAAHYILWTTVDNLSLTYRYDFYYI